MAMKTIIIALLIPFAMVMDILLTIFTITLYLVITDELITTQLIKKL